MEDAASILFAEAKMPQTHAEVQIFGAADIFTQ
jgi:hypothetical protein